MASPISLTSHDGTPLAGLAVDGPAGAPGVVVVPGLGSRKENHADFAERCAAAGMAAVCLDVRGHGASGGTLDAGAVDDVLAAAAWLADRGHGRIGLRGSSMGGFLALLAAAREPRVRAVAAICPARPGPLARRVGDGWPLTLPLIPAVSRPDGVARGYWHATGDESVPWAHSFGLAQHTPQPMRLRVILGGHHRSLQHDPAVQAETVAFLAEHLAP
ncbi:MAG: alpha/beta fold hydrolase [Thermoleophilia bacterium]|nr:alpha/beta fold hydrolase [Thermoleophilia bacterium]